jgi:hypothetical protein
MAAWRSCATRNMAETRYWFPGGEGGSTHFSHGGRCWLARDRAMDGWGIQIIPGPGVEEDHAGERQSS